MTITTNTMTTIVLLFFLSTTTTSTSFYHRHLLHQPFFPLTNAIPPIEPPSLSPQSPPHAQPQQQPPKYPFSATPNIPQKPFFPTLPSPPPPPSISTLATFPANISSLLFPHRPSSSSTSHRHLIITVSISLSLLFIAILSAISAFYLFYSSRHHTTDKTSRSDSLRLFPPNTVPSDGSPKPPKLPPRPGVPNTSSEFLYLGTLVNPTTTGGIKECLNEKVADSSNAGGVRIGVTSSSPYQKLGSPELKPLPPLPKLNYTPTYRSGEVLIGSCNDDDDDEDEDEDEEFFSPRGSSGRKESININIHESSPVHVESSSRREFRGDNFGSRSFNSRTASYPYSNSCSPITSIATSTPSPASNASPQSTKSKSPETIISFPSAGVQSVKRSPLSISLSSSPSLSGRDSGTAQNSPEQNSSFIGQGTSSLIRNESGSRQFVPAKLPPPPPPPPPPRFWEIPEGIRRARELNFGSSGPPVLVTPSRPALVSSSMPVLVNEQAQSNAGIDRSEETMKPKLKPLHWDKVRASSDRAMVWDQIKSSSFQ